MSFIVLADHDDTRGSATVDAFMGAGHAVACFADARQVLEAIRFRLPHLVVLDADLPGSGMAAILHAVRREQRLVTLPVMLLAARSAIDGGRHGLFREADAVLVKPAPADALVRQAERLIRQAASDRAGMERIADDNGWGARLPESRPADASMRFC